MRLFGASLSCGASAGYAGGLSNDLNFNKDELENSVSSKGFKKVDGSNLGNNSSKHAEFGFAARGENNSLHENGTVMKTGGSAISFTSYKDEYSNSYRCIDSSVNPKQTPYLYDELMFFQQTIDEIKTCHDISKLLNHIVSNKNEERCKNIENCKYLFRHFIKIVYIKYCLFEKKIDVKNFTFDFTEFASWVEERCRGKLVVDQAWKEDLEINDSVINFVPWKNDDYLRINTQVKLEKLAIGYYRDSEGIPVVRTKKLSVQGVDVLKNGDIKGIYRGEEAYSIYCRAFTLKWSDMEMLKSDKLASERREINQKHKDSMSSDNYSKLADELKTLTPRIAPGHINRRQAGIALYATCLKNNKNGKNTVACVLGHFANAMKQHNIFEVISIHVSMAICPHDFYLKMQLVGFGVKAKFVDSKTNNPVEVTFNFDEISQDNTKSEINKKILSNIPTLQGNGVDQNEILRFVCIEPYKTEFPTTAFNFLPNDTLEGVIEDLGGGEYLRKNCNKLFRIIWNNNDYHFAKQLLNKKNKIEFDDYLKTNIWITARVIKDKRIFELIRDFFGISRINHIFKEIDRHGNVIESTPLDFAVKVKNSALIFYLKENGARSSVDIKSVAINSNCSEGFEDAKFVNRFTKVLKRLGIIIG